MNRDINMRKVLYLILTLLIVGCSSEEESEQAVKVYTGTCLNAEAWSLPTFDNFMYDSVGVVKTYGVDTTYVLFRRNVNRDSMVLTITGTDGELRTIRNTEMTSMCRVASTEILTYQNGKQIFIYDWKGEPFEEKEYKSETYSVKGSLDGQTLVLTVNDTIYNIQGVGNDEATLNMVAPVREIICIMKLKKR
jgi:hypothetical protein